MFLHYALKELFKRKKKYALNILIISIIVILIITLNSLSLAYKDASRLPFQSIHSSIIIQRNGNVPENTTGALVSCSLAPIKQDILKKIRTMNDVKDISGGLSLWVFDEDNFKRVLGVDWNDTLGRKIKSKIYEGSLPSSDNEAIVEKTYAEKYKLELNKNININGENFIVSGFIETSGKEIVASDIYTNLLPVQKMAFNSKFLQATEKFDKDDINIIFVETEQTKISEVSEKIDEYLNSKDTVSGKTPTGQKINSYSIYTPKSFEKQIVSLFAVSDKIMLIISVVILFGTALIIFKSMTQSITERRKEFGIMKAVGFTKKNMRKLINIELIIEIITGYSIGLILSFGIIWALSFLTVSVNIPWELNPYPHFLAANPDDVKTVQTYNLPMHFNLKYALISLGGILLIGYLAIEILLKKIGTLKPMEALKNE